MVDGPTEGRQQGNQADSNEDELSGQAHGADIREPRPERGGMGLNTATVADNPQQASFSLLYHFFRSGEMDLS